MTTSHQDYDLLNERIRRLEAELSELKRRHDFLEARSLSGSPATGGLLARLTTKQHAALQMILAGKSNAEIAARFGVTENGAKVYVRAISKKAGVNTRSQIVVAAYDEMRGMSSDQYEMMSGGLPKDWAERYLGGDASEDPFSHLYRRAGKD